MALRTQEFTQGAPQAPALTKGMRLGVYGVSGPPLQTIGNMAVLSAANGSFSDILGKGQIDYDSSGFLYVADTNNNRVQRFTKDSSGLWVFDSQCSALNALGSSLILELVAIDRIRGQIHLASSQQNAVGSWVGVWDLSSWPGLTVGNRVRSYGTNGTSGNAPGKAIQGLCLTLIGDAAVVCSSAGDFRVIRWDHTTGFLLAEATKALWMARFASDGTQLYSGAQATSTELGLWLMNPSTLIGITRLDNPFPSGVRYCRRGELVQGVGGDVTDIAYYNGRVYVREVVDNRFMAWDTTGNTFVDEFLWPGGASATGSYGHAPGPLFSPLIQQAKIGVFVGDSTKSDDILAWSGNAEGDFNQSFLTCWPVSVATATWAKTDWSAAANTLKAIALSGENLSGEKVKVRIKKNAGSFVYLTLSQLTDDSAIGAVGTLTSGDTLTVELSLSTWDRLDGHAELIAVRDKLTPQNVRALLVYEDPLSDIFVPQQTAALSARVGTQGGIAVEI